MDCLAFKRKIVRSRSFRADVKTKKDVLINFSKSLSGKTTVGKYDYHWLWESADSKYKVGVGKFGKEYYLNTIKWQDGHKANNPNDIEVNPKVWTKNFGVYLCVRNTIIQHC